MGDTLSVRESELAVERDRVAVRYARLDALRTEKQEQLAGVRRSGLQGSLQNHSELYYKVKSLISNISGNT